MRVVAIIPARFQSSRFPGKPLALICGNLMIQRVYEEISSIEKLDDCYVATDDERIYQCVNGFGGKAILTGQFSCGTDRVEWASRNLECDVIINVQGDEPLIRKEMVKALIDAFNDSSVQMATLKTKIKDSRDIENTNVVKVVVDKNNDALYFSRYPIPFNRDNKTEYNVFKHIGIYAYRKSFLSEVVKMHRPELELFESLEQLRVLWNGYKIKVLHSDYDTAGVDTPDQIKDVEAILRKEGIK